MPIITWNQELSVSIPSIDTQHQMWISTINKLFDQMKEGKANENLESTLKEVIEFTKMHFGNEEKMMKETGYTEINVHKNQHDAFIKKLNDMYDKKKSGGRTVSIEFMEALKEWILNHVKTVDKKYSQHFMTHGIK